MVLAYGSCLLASCARSAPSSRPRGAARCSPWPPSWPSPSAKRGSLRSLCVRFLPRRYPLLEDLVGPRSRRFARTGPAAPRTALTSRSLLPDILEFATQWSPFPTNGKTRPPPLPGDSRLRRWLRPSLIQRPSLRGGLLSLYAPGCPFPSDHGSKRGVRVKSFSLTTNFSERR